MVFIYHSLVLNIREVGPTKVNVSDSIWTRYINFCSSN